MTPSEPMASLCSVSHTLWAEQGAPLPFLPPSRFPTREHLLCAERLLFRMEIGGQRNAELPRSPGLEGRRQQLVTVTVAMAWS